MKHLFRLTIFSLLASAFPVQAEEPDISGKWKFEPKPERVIRDNYFKTLGRSFTLEFRKNAEGEWEVTGDPFGIKMTEFDLDDAEAGGIST